MRPSILTSLLVLTLPLTACNFYFGGGDDPDPCDYGGGYTDTDSSAPSDSLQQSQILRDPQTGQCTDFGWTNPPPCDSECGPCVYPADEPGLERAPFPSWGYCESYCTGLDQDSCLATAGCRGIFSDGDIDTGTFQECWQIDQGGTPLVQTCDGLDAYSCSQQDSCIAQHEFPCGGNSDPLPGGGAPAPTCDAGAFVACHDEGPIDTQGCYGDDECGDGLHCNAATVCLPPPGNGDCDPNSGFCEVPSVCYGYCVPDEVDPGECDGDVICFANPPLCEAGSTPGIADGCWTGQCIDLSLCPQAACNEIVGESMCVARDDCDAFYVGVDCTCDGDGCTCASWDFDSCSAMPSP